MNSTIQGLINLLIDSVPTIVFFIILTFYLKYVFFRPMRRILDERHKQTGGLRELAERANAEADQKLSEFERALQQARNEIYQDTEELRKKWAEEQKEAIERARVNAAEKLADAKQSMNDELRRAEAELKAMVGPLSNEIVETLLRRRAA